jgi:hypothetical protein
MEVIATLIMLIVGLFFGVLFADPIKNWWKDRVIFEKPKYLFRITHLTAADAYPIDFSTRIKEQNAHQKLFKFEVKRAITLTNEEEAKLKGLMRKKDFVETVGHILAHYRNEPWEGLVDRFPDAKDKNPRDIVLTNVPLPGNFYGWNSKDRTFLVISIAPVLNFFQKDERPNLDDFIIRMLQRMATFAVVPGLNPKRTHIDVGTGCLFDFTVELKRVVDVVKISHICSDCLISIKRSQGHKFTVKLNNWIKATPNLGSTIAK